MAYTSINNVISGKSYDDPQDRIKGQDKSSPILCLVLGSNSAQRSWKVVSANIFTAVFVDEAILFVLSISSYLYY